MPYGCNEIHLLGRRLTLLKSCKLNAQIRHNNIHQIVKGCAFIEHNKIVIIMFYF